MTRPCKDGNHRVIPDFDNNMMICKDCPLKISFIATANQFDSRNNFKNEFRKAERDWYIKELES